MKGNEMNRGGGKYFATTYIYILICPVDGLVKYCGKSNNPKRRLKDHCLDFRCMDSGMEKWIKSLLRQNKKPELEVVDEPDVDDWKDRELFWCEYFKSLGYILFNKRSRNGLTYANSKTFRAGRIPWNKGLKFGSKKDLPF